MKTKRYSWLFAGALLAGSAAEAVGQSRSVLDAALESGRAPAIALYRDLLSYPNDAHHPADILRLLEWLERAFGQRDFTTRRLETGSSPVLFAERRHPRAEQTVLIYLQADGQPVDPSRWEQPNPYEAVLKERASDGTWRQIPWDRLERGTNREWRVFARSAADSKAPIAQFLSALDALMAAGQQPSVNLKVIIDTEEEMGSPRLPAVVRANRDLLAADHLLVLDGPPHASGAPTIVYGARGILTFRLTTYGPVVPQHSGHYGNYLPNPARELSRVIASFFDDAGRVVLPGWYDGVTLDSATLAMLDAVPDDEAAIRRAMGVVTPDSVAPTLQRSLQYPSLNVRGMRSAWVGDEARTVIPADATAEFDVRLVMESDPGRLMGLVRSHLDGLGYRVLDQAPTNDERLAHPRLITLEERAPYAAFRTPMDAAVARWIARTLERRNGSPPVHIRTSGGSIPISPFVTTLEIPAVLLPTVNPDNNQHSPNENVTFGAFLDGIATIAYVLIEPFPRQGRAVGEPPAERRRGLAAAAESGDSHRSAVTDQRREKGRIGGATERPLDDLPQPCFSPLWFRLDSRRVRILSTRCARAECPRIACVCRPFSQSGEISCPRR